MTYKSIFLAGLIVGIGNGIMFENDQIYHMSEQKEEAIYGYNKNKLLKKSYKIFVNNGLGFALCSIGFVFGFNTWAKMLC